jgi:hypothetical protein
VTGFLWRMSTSLTRRVTVLEHIAKHHDSHRLSSCPWCTQAEVSSASFRAFGCCHSGGRCS